MRQASRHSSSSNRIPRPGTLGLVAGLAVLSLGSAVRCASQGGDEPGPVVEAEPPPPPPIPLTTTVEELLEERRAWQHDDASEGSPNARHRHPSIRAWYAIAETPENARCARFIEEAKKGNVFILAEPLRWVSGLQTCAPLDEAKKNQASSAAVPTISSARPQDLRTLLKHEEALFAAIAKSPIKEEAQKERENTLLAYLAAAAKAQGNAEGSVEYRQRQYVEYSDATEGAPRPLTLEETLTKAHRLEKAHNNKASIALLEPEAFARFEPATEENTAALAEANAAAAKVEAEAEAALSQANEALAKANAALEKADSQQAGAAIAQADAALADVEAADAALAKAAVEIASEAQQCRRYLIWGTALRKDRQYALALEILGKAIDCADPEVAREAHFLAIRVADIKKSPERKRLAKLFLDRYREHSMADDILTWRSRWQKPTEATKTLREVIALGGDQCARAAFELGWRLFETKKYRQAATVLSRQVNNDACGTVQERDRLRYWTARSMALAGDQVGAETEYRAIVDVRPLSYYGLLSMHRLGVDPDTLEVEDPTKKICAGFVQEHPTLWLAVDALNAKLHQSARALLEASPTPEPRKLPAECHPHSTVLTVAQLHLELGMDAEAHRLVRRIDGLLAPPTDRRALETSYPLSYRDVLSVKETEHKVPKYFLQSIAREESSFEHDVISWAGAHGLLQMMPFTANAVAKQAGLPLPTSEDLVKAEVNADLSGRLVQGLLRQFRKQKWLSLIAYNAGPRHAIRASKTDGDFDMRAEMIPIDETRGYVMRVLTTDAIYRWYYGHEPLALDPGVAL